MATSFCLWFMKVCEALGLPQEFLDIANSIDIIENKNKIHHIIKKLYYYKCKICGSVAEETHHIVEQCDADSNGNFTHFHKNDMHNLVQHVKVVMINHLW